MDKRVYLYLDDLVGNLFITLKQAGYNVDSLSYELIENYGSILERKLKGKGITPIFMLSRDNTIKFLSDNKDLYRQTEDQQIELVGNLSTDDLINKYHGYLPLDILLAVLDKETIEEVKNIYELKRDNKILQKTIK